MKERKIQEFYKDRYQQVYGSGCLGLASKVAHRSIERNINPAGPFGVVLELGAGHGQHLPFVKHGYEVYFETDLNQEILPVRKEEDYPGVVTRVIDAQTLEGIAPHSVDRLIATCLLPHLSDPEAALKNWKRSLKPGGSASIYLPAEPGALLRLAQSITSRRRIEKLGLEYWLAHYREHPYHFPYLRRLINTVFADGLVSWRSYPTPGLGWNLSLWFVVQIRLRS